MPAQRARMPAKRFLLSGTVFRRADSVLAVSVRNGKDRRRALCRVGLDAVGAVSRTKRSAALDSCDSSTAATGPDRTWRPPCF